ncbi:MAG: 50S ribosomal protein L10 [Patescibacteria group bacterium]
MPKNKQQKAEILKKIEEKLSKSKTIVFSTDQGLNVKAVQTLRQQLKQEGAEYLVAKKTLVKKATKDLLAPEKLDEIEGSVGLVLSYDDEVTGAKILHKFVKGNEKLDIVGGVLENKFIDRAMVQRLAILPGRNELLAKLLGSIKSPISGLVGVLSGNTRKLVYALSAIRDKKAS